MSNQEMREEIEFALGKLARPKTFWQRMLYAIARGYEIDATVRQRADKIMSIVERSKNCNTGCRTTKCRGATHE